MPWLVVTGNGSWSPGVLGKTWEEPTTELATGRWVYDSPMFKAGKHHIEQRVRDLAEQEGYPEHVFFFEDNDEPELMPMDDSGVLKPEDVRSNTRHGTYLMPGEEPEAAPEPIIDPEGLPLDFPCPNCERAFPSEGSLDRHIEYNHTRRHEVLRQRAVREAQRKADEKAELRRLEDHEGKLPPWEREHVEQHVNDDAIIKPSNEG